MVVMEVSDKFWWLHEMGVVGTGVEPDTTDCTIMPFAGHKVVVVSHPDVRVWARVRTWGTASTCRGPPASELDVALFANPKCSRCVWPVLVLSAVQCAVDGR